MGFVPTSSILSNKENVQLGFIQLAASATIILTAGHYDCTWGSKFTSKIRTKMMTEAMLSLFGKPPSEPENSSSGPNPFTDLNNK